MKDILQNIKSILLFLIAIIIVIFLYRQQNHIDKLEEELADCNNVVYVHTTDTITDIKIEYVNTILPSDTVFLSEIKYVEKLLSKDDSANIAKKVIGQLIDYNTTRFYDKTFKNDSSAFVRFTASVYKNNILDPQLIFRNNYPLYKYVQQPERTELYAGFGATSTGLMFNAAVLTKSKVFYQVHYDPIHDYYGASINMRIKNFK